MPACNPHGLEQIVMWALSNGASLKFFLKIRVRPYFCAEFKMKVNDIERIVHVEEETFTELLRVIEFRVKAIRVEFRSDVAPYKSKHLDVGGRSYCHVIGEPELTELWRDVNCGRCLAIGKPKRKANGKVQEGS